MIEMGTTMRKPLAAAAIAVAGLMSPAMATTYYVDYEGGDDARAGTKPAAAWKHCPGDGEAAGTAAEATLEPGDQVIFKGGVRYCGTIGGGPKGTAERPVVYDGNTAGDFGTGRAIVDGSAPLTGWTRCTSAADAMGHPNWSKIYYVDIDAPGSWRNLSLSGPDRPLPVAQAPNPSHPMFQERVGDFYRVDQKLGSNLGAEIYAEPGTHVNARRPLITAVTPGRGSTVISPIGEAAFSVEFDEPRTVTALGIALQPKYRPIKRVAFLADGELVKEATLPEENGPMRKFELDEPLTARKFTFKLLEAHGEDGANWTAIRRVGAWNEADENILIFEPTMSLADPEVFTADEADAYTEMTFGIHAGHNFVHYLDIVEYEPAASRIHTEVFADKLYETTRYALYNSVKLIDVPGEYAMHSLGEGRARVYLMPPEVEDGEPVGVSRSVRTGGFALSDAEHVEIRGFDIERQGGRRANGIALGGGSDITVRDCEVAMVRGSTGISASRATRVRVIGSTIRHCPGHTKGLVYHTCTDSDVIDSRFHKNTSTALDYYGCTGGRVAGNTLTGHYGMHANGLTFYLGCKDVIIERNVVYDGNISLTIQEAENIIIRNNILDGDGENMAVGIWVATPFKNVRFLNNLIIRGNPDRDWTTGMFSNNRGPEGLMVKNNIIDGKYGNLSGEYSHNIHTRLGPDQSEDSLGPGERYIPDLGRLVRDPDARDYRPPADSPAIDAGIEVDVDEDFRGRPRPQGDGYDIGAYEKPAD